MLFYLVAFLQIQFFYVSLSVHLVKCIVTLIFFKYFNSFQIVFCDCFKTFHILSCYLLRLESYSLSAYLRFYNKTPSTFLCCYVVLRNSALMHRLPSVFVYGTMFKPSIYRLFGRLFHLDSLAIVPSLLVRIGNQDLQRLCRSIMVTTAFSSF